MELVFFVCDKNIQDFIHKFSSVTLVNHCFQDNISLVIFQLIKITAQV